MAEQDRQGNGTSVSAIILAFLGGAAVGAVAALLLAPQSGRESREQLRGYARRTGEQIRELADKAEETWETAVEKGRQFIQDQKSVLTDALEAGREAMRRQRKEVGEKKDAS